MTTESELRNLSLRISDIEQALFVLNEQIAAQAVAGLPVTHYAYERTSLYNEYHDCIMAYSTGITKTPQPQRYGHLTLVK